MHKAKPGLIMDSPLTAEARESLLEFLFAEQVPHYGEIFVPDDSFYTNKTGQLQADDMLLQLCQWLGIKPGYIGLEYGPALISPPEGRRFTIYIEPWVLKDEFYLGSALAYSLTRYLIEGKKQIQLPPNDQAALLAAASIEFGLGLVIMNGLSPIYGWADKWLAKLVKARHSVIGSIPPNNYSLLVRGFISKYRVNPNTFRHSLAPWAIDRLRIKPSLRTTKTIKDTRQKIHLENIKFAGICWVLTLIIGISVYVFSVRAAPVSPEVAQAEEQITLLNSLTRQCQDSINYKRQYADLTDIQTVRSINAEDTRCQSLDNQRKAAEQSYRHLTANN